MTRRRSTEEHRRGASSACEPVEHEVLLDLHGDGRGEAWADTTPRSSYRLSRCSDLTLAHAAAATCQDRVPGRHLSRSAPPAPSISRRADVEVRAAARQALPALDWLALRSLPQAGCCSSLPTVRGEVASTTEASYPRRAWV